MAAVKQTSCCELPEGSLLLMSWPAPHCILTSTDIVCFQETKMFRQELTSDLGQVEGW